MLGRVDVEHEIDKSSLEPGAGTVQYRKPRTGDLRRSLLVQNAQSFTEIDVILWLEIEITRLAPAADLLIAFFVGSDRDILGRNVGQPAEQLTHCGIGFVTLFFKLRLSIF